MAHDVRAQTVWSNHNKTLRRIEISYAWRSRAILLKISLIMAINDNRMVFPFSPKFDIPLASLFDDMTEQIADLKAAGVVREDED